MDTINPVVQHREPWNKGQTNGFCLELPPRYSSGRNRLRLSLITRTGEQSDLAMFN